MKLRKLKFLQYPTIKKVLLKLYFIAKNIYAYLICSDALYLKIEFRRKFHKKLDLNAPKTFNEKLNWLKLYDRRELYTILADKFNVKQYVASKIGSQYVVPNYGRWQKFDDIDFAQLPDKFVLKTTHDSGGAIVCSDKATFDCKAVSKRLKRDLRTNYYYITREWVYKDIKPMIIADMLLDDNSGHEITDYKFWCFNGVPKVMYITNKGKNIKENFYDMDFNVIDINHGYPRRSPEYDKPHNFDLMKRLAAELSQDIPFVRVDFFDVNGNVYFAEFTFYDWAGLKPFADPKHDELIGSWIDLPIS